MDVDHALQRGDGDAFFVLKAPTRAPFKIALRKEGFDRAREGFALPFPKADFLAVGQKDVGRFQLLGVALGLRLGLGGVDAGALGFDDGERAPVAIA